MRVSAQDITKKSPPANWTRTPPRAAGHPSPRSAAGISIPGPSASARPCHGPQCFRLAAELFPRRSRNTKDGCDATFLQETQPLKAVIEPDRQRPSRPSQQRQSPRDRALGTSADREETVT